MEVKFSGMSNSLEEESLMSKARIYGQSRDKRFIQRCLDEAGLTITALAGQIGISHQAVSATLNGYCHSAKVLDALRNLGVPEKYLCDPRKKDAV